MKLFAALVTLAIATSACGSQASNTSVQMNDSKYVSKRGTLEEVFAIGGETTGYAIKQMNGEYIEVDFKEVGFDVAEAFLGVDVQVSGTMETRFGVEIFSREVLVIDDIRRHNQSHMPF